MRPDLWFGLAITLCGLSVICWSIWAGPWMTKFVWNDGTGEQVLYMSGDVSLKQLADGGLYQAVHYDLKSRTVIRPPQAY